MNNIDNISSNGNSGQINVDAQPSTLDIIQIARAYASQCHNDSNHKYDGKPYTTHLQMVFEFGQKFSKLVDAKQLPYVLAACWTHDTIEDTRQTYNDVKKVCGDVVAEITFALTNEKGRTRKDRANEKYYEGIRQTPFATYVKICDRLANVKYSSERKSNMVDVYRKEAEAFKQSLWNPEYKEMFDEIDRMLTKN